MILPINEKPSLTSYVQHSYPNAIIQSRELLTLSVNKMDNYQWKAIDNDIGYKIEDEKLCLYEKSEYRKDMDFYIQRVCQNKEEIIFKIDYTKRTCNLEYIELYLSFRGIDQFTEKENIYSIKWNQYDININDILYKYDMMQYIYYKVERRDEKIIAYVSVTGDAWEAVGENINLEIDYSAVYYIGIHAYIGKNQYITWKNMNYLQLFYNEVDTNGVWLDYYIFPRKGYDASYNCYCQFLDTIYENLDKHLEVFKDIHQYIKWNIDQKYYVNICLDEYFIDGRKAFNNKHYYHYNLFYGYDDKKSVYYVIGYNNGKIVTSKISYDRFQSKIIIGNSIVKYYFRISDDIVFDVNYFTNLVKEYMYGLNSSSKTANLLTQKKGVYGLDIFNELLTKPKGIYVLINDFRVSFLLLEHCKIMEDRLKFLIAENIIIENQDELTNLCQDMSKRSELLKYSVIKHSMTSGLEDKILLQLDLLYNSEKNFYEALLKTLLDNKYSL